MTPNPPDEPPPVPVSPHLLTWWFGMMAIGGVGFGAVAERHPFGNDVLEHPLIIFFVTVAAVLVVLRFLHGRPVPALISERNLLFGCAIGVVCFLIGDWFAVNLTSMP